MLIDNQNVRITTHGAFFMQDLYKIEHDLNQNDTERYYKFFAAKRQIYAVTENIWYEGRRNYTRRDLC